MILRYNRESEEAKEAGEWVGRARCPARLVCAVSSLLIAVQDTIQVTVEGQAAAVTLGNAGVGDRRVRGRKAAELGRRQRGLVGFVAQEDTAAVQIAFARLGVDGDDFAFVLASARQQQVDASARGGGVGGGKSDLLSDNRVEVGLHGEDERFQRRPFMNAVSIHLDSVRVVYRRADERRENRRNFSCSEIGREEEVGHGVYSAVVSEAEAADLLAGLDAEVGTRQEDR